MAFSFFAQRNFFRVEIVFRPEAWFFADHAVRVKSFEHCDFFLGELHMMMIFGFGWYTLANHSQSNGSVVFDLKSSKESSILKKIRMMASRWNLYSSLVLTLESICRR
jgi:hypothetical protein